jgi:subfamily B ATP-binding cassette protein MsbA
VLAMLAVAAFVVYGATRVFNQQIEPHLFFAAIVCLGGVFDPVRKLGSVNNRLQAAEVSARRLLELKDIRVEEPAAPDAKPPDLPPLANAIEFQGVSFAYPSQPDKLVLDNINLPVRNGQVVALVGPNGSGKTTLMSLLLRFYEPSRGRILIDGHDIARVSLRSLRSQIGLVTQEAVVFADTVWANIAYGADGSVDDEMIRQAAERAHIDDFIQDLSVMHAGRETRGYDALINARSLSGGQRQRLALARAILRDPPILILDEATSQVDSESERRIQEAIADVTRNRTTFIIAHRYSTIAHADLTVVLNEGRIISQGRHAELIETCPFYVNLCETQFAVRA